MGSDAPPARYGVSEDGSAFQTGADFDCRWIAGAARRKCGTPAGTALRLGRVEMNRRLRQLLRQATYNLRGGFLVRPLTIALALGCAGATLAWLEETFPALSDIVPRAIFPSHSDPQVAQFILGGIAGSIMTVVSIVFAILLMTLTLASMQFSPRIIVSFAKDRVTQLNSSHLGISYAV